MKKTPEVVRVECRRLRTEERLSIGEIQSRLNLSRATISSIIRDIPLSGHERAKKHGDPWNKGKRKYVAQESEYHKIAKANKLTGNQIGKLAEAAVLLRLCVRGFAVYQAQFDGDRVDWLVEVGGGRLVRIQVKQVLHCRQGMPILSVRRPEAKRYVDGDFDVIVGFDLFTDTAYVFAWDEVKGKTSVSVSVEAKEAWHKLRM